MMDSIEDYQKLIEKVVMIQRRNPFPKSQNIWQVYGILKYIDETITILYDGEELFYYDTRFLISIKNMDI